MIELALEILGGVLAVLGVGYSLTRPRDPDVAVLESSRGSRADRSR